MIIGVLGSRYGPVSDMQAHTLKMVLKACRGNINELKHLAEIGVAEEAVIIAQEMGFTCIAFPPINRDLISEVALTLSLENRPSADMTTQEQNIVREIEKLIVVPAEFDATNFIRHYAKHHKIPIIMVWPDGSISEELLEDGKGNYLSGM